MIISLIAALTTIDHIIGTKNVVPWYFPIDMKWFKYHTLNKPIIMGRKTFESIGKKPLKNRLNIVLSRSLLNNYNGVSVVQNVSQALSLVINCDEVMIIGGGEVYNTFFPQSKRLYLTYVSTNFHLHGDSWFPMYDANAWQSLFSKNHSINKKNGYYNLNFNIFERL